MIIRKAKENNVPIHERRKRSPSGDIAGSMDRQSNHSGSIRNSTSRKAGHIVRKS